MERVNRLPAAAASYSGLCTSRALGSRGVGGSDQKMAAPRSNFNRKHMCTVRNGGEVLLGHMQARTTNQPQCCAKAPPQKHSHEVIAHVKSQRAKHHRQRGGNYCRQRVLMRLLVHQRAHACARQSDGTSQAEVQFRQVECVACALHATH
jgi:hypothetical protein